MISKKSFSNLIRICLRNNIWSIALTCIGLFFAMPVYGAIYISGLKYKYAIGVYKAEVLPALFRRNVLGEGNILLMFAVGVLAIVTAIGGFSYLFSKQKVDLFHSLPRKRGTLFAANYVAGVLGFLVPYFAFLILTVIIGKACGTVDGLGLLASLMAALFNLLGYIGIYSFAVLAVMLTGNALVSIMASGVFLFYGPFLVAVFGMLKERFFVTYTGYTETGFIHSSIVTMYINLFEKMNGFRGTYSLSVVNIIIYILATALVITADYYLYSIRPSEAAGRAIAFKKSMPVISVALLAPASVFGGLAFEGIADTGRVGYGWIVFGAIVVLAIGHFVIQAIYFSDFKSLFKNLVNPGIASVIVMFVFVTFACDLTGFDNFIPKESEIESMAISSGSLQSNLEYYDFNGDTDEYGNANYWVGAAQYRLDNMNITDKDLIRDFATLALSDSKVYQEKIYAQDEGETYEYLFDGTSYADFLVLYRLKNGKVKCRSYNMDILNNMDMYDRLYSSREYKEGVYDILTADEGEFDNLKVASPIGDMPQKLTKEQMKEIVETYRSELLSQDAYELKQSNPIGYIYQDKIIKENGYPCSYRIHQGHIYPSFTKTIALLDEYGINFDRYMNVDNIESITVRNYNRNYDEGNAEVYDTAADADYAETEFDEKVYISKEDIAKIYSCVVPMEMSDVNYIVKSNENVDIEIMFKEMPVSSKYAVSYVFPKGNMPDFVKADVKYKN